MPITTKETEQSFRKYASTAEVKGKFKKILYELEEAERFSRGDLSINLKETLQFLKVAVSDALTSCENECKELKPKETLEERSYHPYDSGILDTVIRNRK